MRRRWSAARVALAVIALTPHAAVWAAPQPGEPPTVLISRQLSAAQGLAVGETIMLSGKPDGSNPQPFRIAGIYEPMPDPMRINARRLEARLHLPDLLNSASAAAVSAINVDLANPNDAATFETAVAEKIPIPGLNVRSVRGDEGSARIFRVLNRFHLAIAIVTVIASTIFLLALMMMLVDERRETVGILRLIGLRKGRLLLQVFAEGVLIAVAGAAFGIALATLLQGPLNTIFQWRYDTTLTFVRMTPRIAFRCTLLAVPLGIMASLVSAWTLLRGNVLNLARR